MKPSKPSSTTMAAPVRLDLSLLCPRPGNRDLTGDNSLADLAESLRLMGQLHPVHVRSLPDGRYEVLAGVRRWKALQCNKAKKILAIVHDGLSETAADQLRLHENTHRREPSALDIARELRRIKNVNAYTHEEVAAHTALSAGRVKLYLSIFTASDELLSALEKHGLSIAMAVALKKYEVAAGVPAMRRALKGVLSQELTLRDMEVLRKRGPKGVRGSTPRGQVAQDPWKRVKARVRTLGQKDRAAAVLELQALLAELSASLPSAPVASSQ